VQVNGAMVVLATTFHCMPIHLLLSPFSCMHTSFCARLSHLPAKAWIRMLIRRMPTIINSASKLMVPVTWHVRVGVVTEEFDTMVFHTYVRVLKPYRCGVLKNHTSAIRRDFRYADAMPASPGLTYLHYLHTDVVMLCITTT